MHTIIFTDGASRGNPGPGGWGAVLILDKIKSCDVIELGGRESRTTNNRMELQACIQALKYITSENIKSLITIYSDSSYVINGITKWVHGWKINNWLTKTKEPVMNQDLWVELYELCNLAKNINWKYVGGHVGVIGNERCDIIATSFADNKKIDIYKGTLNDYSMPDIRNIRFSEQKMSEKSQKNSRSSAKAYSYISFVKNQIEIHKTWAECENRVKGASGAKFKKALSLQEEKEIVASFRRE
jgi:ribonuclease HI